MRRNSKPISNPICSMKRLPNPIAKPIFSRKRKNNPITKPIYCIGYCIQYMGSTKILSGPIPANEQVIAGVHCQSRDVLNELFELFTELV